MGTEVSLRKAQLTKNYPQEFNYFGASKLAFAGEGVVAG